MSSLKDTTSGIDLYVKEISIDKDNLKKAIYSSHKDAYLLDIPAINQLMNEPLVLDSKITFFIGENGSGKSTLIEGIASALNFNPEGGDKDTIFETRKTNSILGDYLIISRSGAKYKDGYFLRAESLYNVASYLEDVEAKRYGGRLHEMSHGEGFISLIRSRLEGNGLYIFDEPEAALSPSRIMTLMCYMRELEIKNSQFIISTHSPILMTYPNASIFELSDKGINKINYKESEHYKITKNFIEKPEIMFKHLFGEQDD